MIRSAARTRMSACDDGAYRGTATHCVAEHATNTLTSGALLVNGRCELCVGEIAFAAATHAANTLSEDVQYGRASVAIHSAHIMRAPTGGAAMSAARRTVRPRYQNSGALSMNGRCKSYQGCDALYSRRRTAARFAARMRVTNTLTGDVLCIHSARQIPTTHDMLYDRSINRISVRVAAARMRMSACDDGACRGTATHNTTHGHDSVRAAGTRTRMSACDDNTRRGTAMHNFPHTLLCYTTHDSAYRNIAVARVP